MSNIDNRTVINNFTGGGTLQTWPDGEWQILYAKDSAGNFVTLSLTSQDAIRLAYAVSPIPNEQFERMRAATDAVYQLSYPEARSDELRQIADEIECDGGCEGCGPQSQDRGEFCGFIAANNLRDLAKALDLKAALAQAAKAPAVSEADVGRIQPAIDALTNGQEQCNEDGVMVRVSRQALVEVLAFIQSAAQGGGTESDGSVEGHADPSCGRSSRASHFSRELEEAGIKPGPSDPPSQEASAPEAKS